MDLNQYILCIIDKVTNYLIMVPIYQSKAGEIGDALIEHIITKYCIPDCIIIDQEGTFISVSFSLCLTYCTPRTKFQVLYYRINLLR